MKINKLLIENFKGIKKLELSPQGKNLDIFGDNERGKTTIMDSFQWLLFGKDSEGKAKFDIKPLDEDNNVIPGLMPTVECEFEGITLKKVYSEKWVKQTGSAERVFSGNTTDHYIDGVPVKEKEYSAQIAEIADEELFKLLTNPLYFNAQIPWKKRRDTLIGICGDVSDEEIISKTEGIEKLKQVLGKYSIDQYRKIMDEKKKTINEELKKIPTRIDEAERAKPSIEGMDFTSIEQEIEVVRKQQGEFREQLTRINSGGEIASKNQELSKMNAAILDLKTNIRQKMFNEVKPFEEKLDKECELQRTISGELQTLTSSIERAERTIKTAEADIEKLYEKYDKEEAKIFEMSQESECPTCGQALPEEQLIATREKAQEQFNIGKSQMLEDIKADGKAQRDTQTKAQQELDTHKQELEKKQSEYKITSDKIESLKTQITALKAKYVTLDSLPEYMELTKQRDELQTVIDGLKEGVGVLLEDVQDSIDGCEQKIKALQADFAKKDSHEQGNIRINELREQERKLATEYEKIEGALHLCEQFTRAKVSVLEGKINSMFKMAKFKMFSQLVNGGLEECCEVTYKGVPYSSMNNAARIQVGIDIINTLSEYYKFDAPIFADNAESVTSLPETKAQLFRLIVSEKHKKLYVEVV